MKIKNKFIGLISVICLLVVLASCSEASPIKSQITEFPSFEIDEPYSIIQTGSSFSDSGVKAIAGTDELPFTTSGTVNTNTPGVYKLDYAATNDDGFDGTAFRYIIVVDNPDFVKSSDLSGSYTRDSNSAHIMTLTKVADGVYHADDILPTNNISVFVFHVSDTEVVIPRQPSRFGDIVADPSDVSGSSGIISGDGDITLNTFIGCCGIFTRNFLKD
ncbi:immunoglobulin-like domain-containing protein [Tamlana crocina]